SEMAAAAAPPAAAAAPEPFPDPMPDPFPIHLSSRVNLDHLFAFETVKSLGEPMTPFRLSVYLLIRSLDADIYEEGCSGENHARISALLYGLLEAQQELTFAQVCRLVRKRVCPIIHDALDHYLKMVQEALQTDGITLKFDSLGLKRGLVANKSLLEHYVQRLQSAEKLMTYQQHRQLMQQLKAFVKGEENKDVLMRAIAAPAPSLPRCISTGSHARVWLMQQLHLQQVSPLEVDVRIDEYAGLVAAAFRDIPAVHLLLMLRAVYRVDQPTAVDELRAFFDYSMIRLQDLLTHIAPQKNRMVTVDHRQVRYAPLLQARLYRIFGDKALARRLLNETISQAYLNKEMTCLRLALVESAAVEIMPERREHAMKTRKPANDGRQKEAKKEQRDTLHAEDESELVPASIKSVDLKSHLAMMADDVPARMEGEERRELSTDPQEHQYMVMRSVDTGKLVAAITMFIKCDIPEAREDVPMAPLQHAVIGASCSSSGPDSMGKSRELSDAAAAFTAVARLHAGYVVSATAHARALYECDMPDYYAKRHDTETKAVAGVTMAFGLASNGEWTEALSLCAQLEARFCVKGSYPAATRHVVGAAALIRFDAAFVKGNFAAAEDCLLTVESVHPNEAAMRRCLLLCARGNQSDAVALLKLAREGVNEDLDLPTAIRMDMQLGVLLARVGEGQPALQLLQKTVRLSSSRGLQRLHVMSQRRLAMVELMFGCAKDAKRILETIEAEIHSTGGLIERVLYCLTVAECGYQIKQCAIRDKKEWAAGASGHVSALGRARLHAEQIGCTPLEKTALSMAARVMNKGEHFSKIVERLKELNDKCPANIDWTTM
ncbi:gfi-3, partial [Pristionchus pacificus]|uniref:Anaphase-promoting complex subunit 5 n=1 Tax=Pristionchus pacificus TaxID=54126 RepID=A0A8R1Z7I4_PRIPA